MTVWATGGENYSVTLSIFFWAVTQCLCSCSFCEHYERINYFVNHEEHKLYVQKQKPWLSLCGAIAHAILVLIPDFYSLSISQFLGHFGDVRLKATAEPGRWRISWPGLNAGRQQTAPC